LQIYKYIFDYIFVKEKKSNKVLTFFLKEKAFLFGVLNGFN